jgi:heat shock protein HslJ
MVTPIKDQEVVVSVVQGDYRLHDIWALRTVNGIDISREQSNAYLEFNLTTEKVYGNTGCNSLSGDLKVDADTLIMSNLAVSEMICVRFPFEQNYINQLKLPMEYSIDGLQLTLSSNQSTLVFQKVD